MNLWRNQGHTTWCFLSVHILFEKGALSKLLPKRCGPEAPPPPPPPPRHPTVIPDGKGTPSAYGHSDILKGQRLLMLSLGFTACVLVSSLERQPLGILPLLKFHQQNQSFSLMLTLVSMVILFIIWPNLCWSNPRYVRQLTCVQYSFRRSCQTVILKMFF